MILLNVDPCASCSDCRSDRTLTVSPPCPELRGKECLLSAEIIGWWGHHPRLRWPYAVAVPVAASANSLNYNSGTAGYLTSCNTSSASLRSFKILRQTPKSFAEVMS